MPKLSTDAVTPSTSTVTANTYTSYTNTPSHTLKVILNYPARLLGNTAAQ